nr:MAG TPA: adhesin [Caudoviricetes sp.]
MKKLAVAVMLGIGVMVSGCGNTEQMQVNNVPTTQQTQKVDDGVSLAKAVDLAKKGEFKPQTVRFEGNVTDKVFGDEPEIIVTTTIRMGDKAKFVHIHVTDHEVIKRVAKLQDEQKNNFVRGTGKINASEITFTNWSIEVK